MEVIDISPGQMDIIKLILRKNLPSGIIIWGFGSRASCTAKEFSDLDIALQQENGQSIAFGLMANLMDDFEESDLPYKVNVVDYNTASGIFKQNIDSPKVKLTIG